MNSNIYVMFSAFIPMGMISLGGNVSNNQTVKLFFVVIGITLLINQLICLIIFVKQNW